jgi:hypothetical protein
MRHRPNKHSSAFLFLFYRRYPIETESNERWGGAARWIFENSIADEDLCLTHFGRTFNFRRKRFCMLMVDGYLAAIRRHPSVVEDTRV